MHKLSPTIAEIEALAARIAPGPVVIINLLKFKPGLDARAAYLRYVADAHGASNPDMELLHCGEILADVGGGEHWDYTIVVRYRNFADFAAVVTSDIWQHAARHRGEALEKTLMMVSSPGELGALAAG